MDDELDTVFVASIYWTNPPNMSCLEWVFSNFDKDKTKIIVTTHWTYDQKYRDMFIRVAEFTYLPRCRTKQFKVEMLTPRADQRKESILELLRSHGMKKLVIDINSMSDILPAFDESPNSSCKVWFIDASKDKLEIRLFGPDLDLQEVEKFKKIAEDATNEHRNFEKMLFIMTEQANTNEQKIEHLTQLNDQLTQNAATNQQKIEHLTQLNDQLTQNAALNASITFQELEEATQNFCDSLKIGEGGYGNMYRGTFRGTTVVVKKFISQNEQVLADFQKEVVILSTVRHPNLIILMEVCSDPPVLVYEYLSNMSLHDHLQHHTGKPLLWQTRTRIIGEICLALIYLHSNKPDPIIHGDLKPDNVYLDANFTSKLSDFGPIKQAHTNANLLRCVDPERTFAYMDPGFLKTGKMREESDVYSLGVIILRLITGKTPLDIRKKVEESIENNQFPSMIDRSAGKWPFHHAEQMAKIGIRCAHDSTTKRPHLVNEVWPIIEGLLKFPDEVMCGRSLGQGHD